jgi:hypothetical protein
MIQKLADYRRFLYKCKYPHCADTLGTGERINLVNLLDQSGSGFDTENDWGIFNTESRLN